MERKVELIVTKTADGYELRSPEVGHFTCALRRDALVSPGNDVGKLISLGETVSLAVPAGVRGRVVSRRPERVHAPVGYGDVLYELAPLQVGDAAAATDAEADAGSDLVFKCPHAGRFWHRPSPKDPAFIEAGQVIDSGATIGLIEVMKTFTNLSYKATGSLPKRARITRILVPDGGEASEGDGLLEVEPA